MESYESLLKRVQVVVDDRTENEHIYHWRAGGPSTLCGLDYSYEKLGLMSLAEVQESYEPCIKCSEVTKSIEKGWSE